jgi:hypothetical protein
MQGEWAVAEMGVLEYRETGTYIIKVEEQITQMLDDHIVMTQSMTFSPYKKVRCFWARCLCLCLVPGLVPAMVLVLELVFCAWAWAWAWAWACACDVRGVLCTCARRPHLHDAEHMTFSPYKKARVCEVFGRACVLGVPVFWACLCFVPGSGPVLALTQSMTFFSPYKKVRVWGVFGRGACLCFVPVPVPVLALVMCGVCCVPVLDDHIVRRRA